MAEMRNQDTLEEAVSALALRGMNVSIYNHQLCVLRRPLWRFARKSISDFKNIYLDTCQACAVLDECGGLFKSAEQIHSQHIRALSAEELAGPVGSGKATRAIRAPQEQAIHTTSSLASPLSCPPSGGSTKRMTSFSGQP
jgi:hypothetical protein